MSRLPLGLGTPPMMQLDLARASANLAGIMGSMKPELCAMATPRLRLRLWHDRDAEPFAAMNADPRVREHFLNVMTREESDASMARIRAHFTDYGFGAWAVELRDRPGLIGFAGVTHPSFTAPCGPCVEIGWRFAFDHWGHGYATEAAREALRAGFEIVGLHEIVAFATVGNVRSRRVMEKIGLLHDEADDFDHPLLPAGHRVSRHVLYRLRKTDWEHRAAV
jgi:RimJ/RimL family protein N-acetyltransferase